MVAQVAAEEPLTEPKMPQPRMVVCIRRPGMRLSHGRRPSNISSLSLVRNRISPIQMNSGRAASSHEALLSQKAENRFLPGCVLTKKAWPDPSADGQRHGDPDPAGEQDQHDDQQEEADSKGFHGVCLVVVRQMSEEKSPCACRSSTAVT